MTLQLYIAVAVVLGIAGLLVFPGAMGYRLRTVRLKFAELVLFLAMAAIGIIGYGDKFSPTNNPPNGLNRPMVMMFNPQPAGPTVTETDVARGFSVVSVGTNEVFDFAMPTGGVRVAKWWLRGGSNDKAFVPGGIAMIGGEILDKLPRPTARYCPLKATSLLVAGESEFWHRQTASNSTVYTWKDAYLRRNISLPFSMQAEIFGNGDFEYRYDLSRISDMGALTNVVVGAKFGTNELDDVSALLDGTNVLSSIRFRRLSEFDWDGDGLANEIDAAPYAKNGDCHGQGDGWVAACCTNAAEIAAAGGYANWVDGQVGLGLTNGLYRLAVSIPCSAVFPMKVSVGDYRIVATNSGDLSFLMEKGVEYGLRVEPYCEGVVFSAVDDISGGTRGAAPARGAVPWGSGWSVDGGTLELQPPTATADGLCLWLPSFTAMPDIGHWNPGTGPVVFAADMIDCAPDAQISYLWHGDDLLVIDSPSARQTVVHISSFPRWQGASMSVTATFCGRDYVSELQFSAGTNDYPTASLSLTAPSNLLVTNLWMEGSRSVEAQVAFSSDVATNGTIRVFALSGGGKIRTSISLPAEFTVQNATAFEHAFTVDGVEASSLLGDVVLGCEWLDAEGTNALQATASITVVEPTLVTVPSAPPTGLVVLVGSNVRTQLTTMPSVVGGLSVEWLTARRRTRYAYEPWATAASGGLEGVLTMAQAGCFAIAARAICGGGTQSNHLEYVWSHDEGYSAVIHEDLGPCKTGERDHVGVASSEALLHLRNQALLHLGLAEYEFGESVSAGNGFSGVEKRKWKCNRFVADMAVESGLTVPAIHVSSHAWPLPDTRYPPVANEWGAGSTSIAGWTHLGVNVSPEPGFVAGRPSPGGIGHCGIVDYDGWTISARQHGISRNAKKMLDGSCGYNKPEVTNGNGNSSNE